MTVDEFVQAKVRPEHRGIVRRIRKLMREVCPSATEAIAYGMPVWKGKRIFAWILPGRQHVNLGFSRGARFDDKYGLLQGMGKTSRHIKLKVTKDVDKKVLTYYVKQAVAFDRK